MSKRKHSNVSLAPSKRVASVNSKDSSWLSLYSDNPWQELYDMYDQALSESDYKEVAGSVSTAIIKLTEHFVSLLDLRARAHGHASEFQLGLNDGFKMIAEAPTCALGYIRTGHIYCLQGNLVKALEVLLKGLSSVPVYDANYVLMQQDADEAEGRMSDYVSELGREARFDKALRIAWDMIHVHQKSPTGYLCAGALHLMQGRAQAAIDMYQEGLLQVSDSDPKHRRLEDQLQLATEMRERRLDIVSMLPFDLMSPILSRLSMPELIICMDVSRAWRERVLQCTDAWRRLEVNSKYEMSLVKSVSEHIRHLKIDAGGESTDMCLQLIANREIANLESLGNCDKKHIAIPTKTFPSEIDTAFRQAPTVRRFFSAFREIGASLRTLNLKFSRTNSHPPPLIPILSVCPSLTHVIYHTWNLRRQDVKGVRMSQTFALTHLDLFTDRSIESAELEAVLRHCPKMLCLVLYKCHPGCLRLIPEYCKEVEYFSLNRSNFLKDGGHWDQIPKDDSTSGGLRSLSIYTSDIIGPQGVVQFINMNKDTVGELALGIGDGDRSFTTLIQPWASLALFEWNLQLRKIDFSLERCSTAILCTMISRCPNLETVKLDRTSSLTDEVFYTLNELTKLQQLELAGGTNTRITDEGLSWFFSQVQNGDRLREVCLSDMSPIKGNSLLALAKVKSLRKVTIRRCQGIMDRAMDQFAEALVISSIALEELTFYVMASVTNAALAKLGQIKTLRDITLIRCSRIDDEGIGELLNHWKTFKSLYIHGCFRVRHSTMYYSRGRVPKAFTRASS